MKLFGRLFEAIPGAILMVVVWALAGSPAWGAAGQTGTVSPVNMPGASALAVNGLNAAGQVAGYWYDAQGVQRAFLSRDGVLFDLGSLGGRFSVGVALNGAGQVVGNSSLPGDTEFHAFLFSGGSMNALGTLGGTISDALAVNDAGQVTGYSYLNQVNLERHAFRFAGGQMEDLGTLGGSYSLGFAINRGGQVAGESATLHDAQIHAFLFTAGAMMDLGTLGGTFSSPNGLNNAGQVTGASTTPQDAEMHAFVFDGGALRDLGTLGGTYSEGFVINDLGQVAGDSLLTGDTEYHGFLYDSGVVQDLGTFGGDYSSAWALNNHGQVVGVSSTAAGQPRAFLWEQGRMVDLNDLMPPDSGWELEAAYFLNDAGQVVGTGNYLGQPAWFFLTLGPAANSAPVANAGADQAIECAGAETRVELDGNASSDPDNDLLTFEWRLGQTVLGTGARLALNVACGDYTFTLQVTDTLGASSEDTVQVRVADTTPPAISSVTPSLSVLNPLNHQMVPVALTVVAADVCDATPSSRILSVVSSEPETSQGDKTSPDCLITGPLAVALRAESVSNDELRSYTITVECSDASGNTATAAVTVTTQRNHKPEAESSGKRTPTK